MVGFWEGMTALVDEWKKEVEPGTRITYLLEMVDDQAGVSSNLDSDSPTPKIIRAILSVMDAVPGGAKAGENMGEEINQFETVEELLAETSLEGLLSANSPIQMDSLE